MKQNITLEAIALHQADERKRLGRKNYYGIREILRDRLDTKVGYVKAASINYYFNEMYKNKKHPDLPFAESEGLKVYTYARYLSRNHDLKWKYTKEK